ncbi:dihydrodipicolinate synthase/N-acetylneuraminate lyase [Thecamonas trahens ATCC 50062]|uniref:Dihydrodipicolinate synthase/N-acetylneuraminate lyase n=1 Tax=Thecamonas trahens ATCC 50062 TaxID=461836 RepID=A0A0L0DT87_THETB|nr:dihydrodipicolinate synthase/N-acetylneuraminate lyase [Thecamonas trahens ATCC 50062]KNC55480.1 dihydrodipicolinate synthase/N-acetylneuraminate lyase [Thecamonas trahens ATCC 50062]|eukprot:XP_013761260.1 dihydrodipicolinate synthase/N-acetylneuraminate lyase [Thecamonas trahens ATCC 50062]
MNLLRTGRLTLTALVTPRVATTSACSGSVGSLDLAALEDNVRRQAASGVTGLVALGSSGEWSSLAFDAKATVLEVVGDVERRRRADDPSASPLLLTAGTGGNCPDESRELGEVAAAAGFAALMVVPPHYYGPMTSKSDLLAYYLEVADSAPLPVVLYNIPQLTVGVDLTPSMVSKLASHANVVGIKDSIGSVVRLQQLVAATANADDFAVITGSPSILVPALMAGAAGSITGLANVCAARVEALTAATSAVLEHGASADRMQAIVREQAALATANNKLGAYGIPGLKAAVDIAGAGTAGLPFAPMTPVTGDERDAIAALLDATSGIPLARPIDPATAL